MIDIQNNLSYNQLRWGKLGGDVSGICQGNQFFIGSNSYPIMPYHYMTANFVKFEKHISRQMPDISYHLSGYGLTFNEALVSFLGESAERYSYSLLPRMIDKQTVISSYDAMLETYSDDLICPLDLVNQYYQSKDDNHYLLTSDVIAWVKMQSLVELGKSVWIPKQMIVIYDHGIFEQEKRYVTSVVSTGTACHEDFSRSLENALIEYLQIDSFNMWWYLGWQGKQLEVDVRQVLIDWFEEEAAVSDFLRHFDVRFTDVSFDKGIAVVLCEIQGSDKRPYIPQYTVGVQGGYDIQRAIHRSFMEAVTVLEFNMNVGWTNSEAYQAVDKQINNIDNLDDNIIYYAKYGKPKRLNKQEAPENVNKVQDLKGLLDHVEELSQYAAYLDITPSEFRGMNLSVSRVVIPELLPMHLPSYPPYYHVRYQREGGIINHLPHPLA